MFSIGVSLSRHLTDEQTVCVHEECKLNFSITVADLYMFMLLWQCFSNMHVVFLYVCPYRHPTVNSRTPKSWSRHLPYPSNSPSHGPSSQILTISCGSWIQYQPQHPPDVAPYRQGAAPTMCLYLLWGFLHPLLTRQLNSSVAIQYQHGTILPLGLIMLLICIASHNGLISAPLQLSIHICQTLQTWENRGSLLS